ncbi:MAG: DNA translocase FtsK [Caldilineaceae bacterium]|nr:DNA translocase FtsK [Caldilineaceae bacterium]MBP8106971.1 DNA translocase FtsK [Caldilineaceae bacterium]MBP8121785.1 DNA translocase FtsK [Caldilineaceae bacterium]MBP9072363.1 DNA translocase FtsK [Caldilineaceae bacterium]
MPRKRTKNVQTQGLQEILTELQENVSREAVGGILLVAGGYFLFTLFAPAGLGAPWLAAMLGWTALPTAVVLILVGLILILGERAGYWSAEALVGTELLLMTLAVTTFVWQTQTVDWSPTMTGQKGGLLGWAFGSLLMAGLGRIPALAALLLLGMLGVGLIMRYTPLVYIFPAMSALFPALAAIPWPRFSLDFLRPVPLAPRPTLDERYARPPAALPETPNFVKATQLIQTEDAEEEAEPSLTRGGAVIAAPAVKKTKKASTPTIKPNRSPEDLPATDLLDADSGIYGSTDAKAMGQLIETTLADFNVPVRVVNVESGPTVTQFGVEPQYLERSGQRRKIRVNRIVNLADDLALALAAPAVRIEAPVPGRPFVGIEVPNTTKSLVGLRGIMESKEVDTKGGYLPLALGRDTSGAAIVTDLTRSPHLLIAGATGSGKSVCLNAIITGLLMRHGPESLNFVMVDPKMVELPGYNGIPHLLGKVITDVSTVTGALTWLLIQMDDRYLLFKEAGVRNIAAYNALVRKRKEVAQLPYIVLVVDELADLMMTAPEEIEKQICRLAQMARATGIHLILATQRPSVDVVTGLIKANFPSRIAFAVTSQIDSRVILDTPGAEKLLGQGDMLLMRPDESKLFRVQGCFVADSEIARVTKFWRQVDKDGALSPAVPPWNGLMDRMDDEDELILDAMDAIRGLDSCSTSLVQRKLRIGYPKAARLMNQLEARGAVGPDLGGGQGRQVLLKAENEDENQEDESEDDYL